MVTLNKIIKHIPFQNGDDEAVFYLVGRIFKKTPKYRYYVQRKIKNEVTNKYNIKFICKLKSIGT